jgi:glycosyltransferase involved in cell wall biosynthesis
MSMGDRASIIINNYNYGRFLGAAIDSALGQTYGDAEVIVVDDGSTDESREVIQSYGERVLGVLKENGGQASACNAGFTASRGHIVVFLDADDVLLPTAVQRSVELFDSPRVVKVHWPLWEIDTQAVRTGRRKPTVELAKGDLLGEVVENGHTLRYNSSTSGSAWRRAFLDEVMPIQECGDRHGADAYLCALAPIFGVLRVSEEPLACYRLHTDNYAAGYGPQARFRSILGRHDFLSKLTVEYLARRGISVDAAAWKQLRKFHDWMREMLEIPPEIGSVVPEGSTLVLVDENQLGGEGFGTRRVLPFLERNEQFWGLPADSDHAIRELERMRQAGAEFVAFIRSTRWWLEYYGGFARYLRMEHRCLLDSVRLTVFDLRPRACGHGSPSPI